jgi:hypothetical protein
MFQISRIGLPVESGGIAADARVKPGHDDKLLMYKHNRHGRA